MNNGFPKTLESKKAIKYKIKKRVTNNIKGLNETTGVLNQLITNLNEASEDELSHSIP